MNLPPVPPPWTQRSHRYSYSYSVWFRQPALTNTDSGWRQATWSYNRDVMDREYERLKQMPADDILDVMLVEAEWTPVRWSSRDPGRLDPAHDGQ